MAYVAAEPIITRIREVLDSALGTLRTLASTRLEDALHQGSSDQELARRGFHSSKPFQVRPVSIRRHPSSPGPMGNVQLHELTVDVVVGRAVGPMEAVDPDKMQVIYAYSVEDADAIAQVLEFPGNLTATSTSLTTDIAGGHLRYQTSSYRMIGGRADQAQRFEGAHRFTGVLITRPSTVAILLAESGDHLRTESGDQLTV